MLKVCGLLSAFISIIITTWWLTSNKPYKGWFFAICLVVIFFSIFLIIQDRATEITVKGVGTIKAAVEQATEDVNEIAELKKRVEAQSATIDLVAEKATKAQDLSEEIASKNEIAAKKLDQINSTLELAKNNLIELQSITDFIITVIAAQNDDRLAFDRLKKWSEDKKFPFHNRAKQAFIKIFEEHSKPYFTSGSKVPWPDDLDPSKLNLGDLINTYNTAPAFLKPAFIEYIWNRNDFDKISRLQFLINVIKNDISLNAIEYAGRYFTDGVNLKIKPLAIDYLIDWWEKNKNNIK